MDALLLAFSLIFSAERLETVDHFLAQDTFLQAFTMGDRVSVLSKSCALGHCDQARYEYEVTSIENQSATVVTRNRDKEIHRSQVHGSDWAMQKHNMIRFKLKFLESYGFQTELLDVRPSKKQVVFNGTPSEMDTLVVEIAAQNAAGMKSKMTYEVAPGVGGLAQLLSSREEKGLGGVEHFDALEIHRPAAQ